LEVLMGELASPLGANQVQDNSFAKGRGLGGINPL
jgi:hypothetical protein